MTAADVHVDPVLSPAADDTETIRHGLRHAQRIVLRAEQAGDEGTWAPVKFQAKCVDRTGYQRRHHEYLIWTRAGYRCLWCDRLCYHHPCHECRHPGERIA